MSENRQVGLVCDQAFCRPARLRSLELDQWPQIERSLAVRRQNACQACDRAQCWRQLGRFQVQNQVGQHEGCGSRRDPFIDRGGFNYSRTLLRQIYGTVSTLPHFSFA
jgi:hypothetical protein